MLLMASSCAARLALSGESFGSAERALRATWYDSFAQPGIAGKTCGQPTLGLHLVDDVVEHFVLFLHGLQHGPDFVELGPRDGGIQRFAPWPLPEGRDIDR